MHEIRVSIMSPESADHGGAELWFADDLIGYTVLDDGDLMLRIEPRRDHAAVVIGARSLAPALTRAEPLLEHPQRTVAGLASAITVHEPYESRSERRQP